MGLTLSKLLMRVVGKKQVKILMLGLDGAGKTTILYKMRLGEVVATIPTIGFNVETVELKNVSFTVWDVGGQDRIRPLWRHYYAGTTAVIFVVDSADTDRLEEAARELRAILAESQLLKAMLLVLANKQDLPGALSKEEVVHRLCLDALGCRWRVQPTCAVQGSGIYEGIDWLTSQIDMLR